MKKTVLVIISHPDDETIWMGGTLLRNKNEWDTTIICLCRADDEDRAPKFEKACKEFNAKGFISDLDDEIDNPVPISEYIKRIKQFADKKYDIIYTHGENGEYKHIRHIETNRAVVNLISSKQLLCKELFFFSYIKKDNNYQGFCLHNSNANIFIKLNNLEILTKKNIIQNIYGYSKGGFEEKSCNNIETFDKK